MARAAGDTGVIDAIGGKGFSIEKTHADAACYGVIGIAFIVKEANDIEEIVLTAPMLRRDVWQQF